MKQKYQNDLGFIGIYVLLLLLPLLLTAQEPIIGKNISNLESIREVERSTLQELLQANPTNRLSEKWTSLENGKSCEVCLLKEVKCDKEGFIMDLNLADKNLTALPASIHNLTKLKELHLEKNQLTWLPATLGNMSYLEELSIFENALESLPRELRNLCGISVVKGLEGNPIRRYMTWAEFCGGTAELSELRINKESLLTYNYVPLLQPNPASDYVSLTRIPQGKTLVQFFDVHGKLMLEKEFMGKSEYTISLSEIPDGIYFVKIINELNQSVVRLVVG